MIDWFAVIGACGALFVGWCLGWWRGYANGEREGRITGERRIVDTQRDEWIETGKSRGYSQAIDDLIQLRKRSLGIKAET